VQVLSVGTLNARVLSIGFLLSKLVINLQDAVGFIPYHMLDLIRSRIQVFKSGFPICVELN